MLWLCLPASLCVAGSLISISAWHRVSCRKSWYPWIRQLEKSLTERLFTEVWTESCRDTAVTRAGNSGSQPLNLGEGDGDRDRKPLDPGENRLYGEDCGLWPRDAATAVPWEGWGSEHPLTLCLPPLSCWCPHLVNPLPPQDSPSGQGEHSEETAGDV